MGVGRTFTVVVVVSMRVVMGMGMIMIVIMIVVMMVMLPIMMVVVTLPVLMPLDGGLTLAAAAYRTHHSTSNSLIRNSSPPVTCNP